MKEILNNFYRKPNSNGRFYPITGYLKGMFCDEVYINGYWVTLEDLKDWEKLW